MDINVELRSLPLEHSEVLPQHTADEASQAEMPSKGIKWIDNATILTPTSGFLAPGYTHTLNSSVGCAFAGALCGTFCYAQHNHWITKGRSWALYGVKRNLQDAYRRQYDQLKHPRQGIPHPLNLYMSSSTDPYIPQEKRLRHTRALLEEMVQRPPDVLVIQTHNTLIHRDLDLIQAIAARCELWISVTVETDMDRVPGFPPHASPPVKRLEVLKAFRHAGVQTQATISPLMPLAHPEVFARQLDEACVRVIVDHYLLGDGSQGLRTKRTNFEQLLRQAGFGEWTRLEKMWEVRDLLARVLGPERVLVSAEGFNAVGGRRNSAIPIIHNDKNGLLSRPDAPQPAQPPTDTETSAPPRADAALLRLNRENGVAPDVYESLRDHQQTTSENLRVLHSFLPRLIKRFYRDLPLPALSWGSAPPGNLGWYLEKDGLALRHRINVNSMYATRPLADILRTLTHELGHEWQHIHGKPGKHGYHNKQFQLKMQEIGIPCNKRGFPSGCKSRSRVFSRSLESRQMLSHLNRQMMRRSKNPLPDQALG